MGAENQSPSINQVYHSWADMSVVLKAYDGGAPIRSEDYRGLTYKQSLTPGEARGNGTIVRGSTKGEYKAEGSITLLMASALRFLEALRDIARQQQILPGEVHFEVVANWRTRPGADMEEVRLVGCRVTDSALDTSPSTDAVEKELPLWVTKIYENGVCLGEVPKS
jgi:hypothetical protein